jgi:hypothetical protein
MWQVRREGIPNAANAANATAVGRRVPHVVVRCLRGEAVSVLRLRHATFLEAWESFTCLGWPTVAGER